MIVNIPIESIESRYSADWCRWFQDELGKRYSTSHWTIHDNMWMLRKDIKDGAFLDVVGTNYYKAKQIEFICQLVDQGFIKRNERVIFLIHDGWFPVEQLAYMRDMLGCHEWKFVGIFHAGTYDRWDQTAQHGMYTWGEDLENAWFKIYDAIVVATVYHDNLLRATRKVTCPSFVIPWKVQVPEIKQVQRKDWIVFPHRHYPEKLNGLPSSVTQAKNLPDNYQWFDTMRCVDKRSYYEVLAQAKIAVSFSLQETFGIAMVEAVLLGCIPLVPDRLSYKELYPKEFRYQGESEFKRKLKMFCDDYDKWVQGNTFKDLQEQFKRNSKTFFPELFGYLEEL